MLLRIGGAQYLSSGFGVKFSFNTRMRIVVNFIVAEYSSHEHESIVQQISNELALASVKAKEIEQRISDGDLHSYIMLPIKLRSAHFFKAAAADH